MEVVEELTETDLYPTGEKQDLHPVLMQKDFWKQTTLNTTQHIPSASHKQGWECDAIISRVIL